MFAIKNEIMEAAGLALGIAGLAGLFGSCLEVIEKVQYYRAFGSDSQDLEAQFNAEKLRFERWGRQVGFDKGVLAQQHHQSLEDPETRLTVTGLLEVVKKIYQAGDGHSQPALNARQLKHDPFSENQIQLSRNAPSESKRRRFAWALWGKEERTEQVKLFGNIVQQLHNIVPPTRPLGTVPVRDALFPGLQKLINRLEENHRGKAALS